MKFCPSTQNRYYKKKISIIVVKWETKVSTYTKSSSSHSTKGESKSVNIKKEVKTLLNDKPSSPSKGKTHNSLEKHL